MKKELNVYLAENTVIHGLDRIDKIKLVQEVNEADLVIGNRLSILRLVLELTSLQRMNKVFLVINGGEELKNFNIRVLKTQNDLSRIVEEILNDDDASSKISSS